MSYDLIRLDDEKKGDEKDGQGAGGPMAKLFQSRTIIVSKGVDDELARSVIGQLFALEQDDPEKVITVIVNSPGGSADCGFAMLDAMRFVSCPIRTITMGLSASAGVMIHLGGDKGQRFITPHSRFLLHQPSMRTMGQASDIEIVASEIERIRAVYNGVVSEATGKPMDEISAQADRDFWLSATQAVEYGLADRIIATRGELG
ncbi:MAG: ATP-dependent Clp protease proteolytic subunit [Planctomycetota bacterium]